MVYINIACITQKLKIWLTAGRATRVEEDHIEAAKLNFSNTVRLT